MGNENEKLNNETEIDSKMEVKSEDIPEDKPAAEDEPVQEAEPKPNTFWKIMLKTDIRAMHQELEKMRFATMQLAHTMKQYEEATSIEFPHKEYHKIASLLQEANIKLKIFLNKKG